MKKGFDYKYEHKTRDKLIWAILLIGIASISLLIALFVITESAGC